VADVILENLRACLTAESLILGRQAAFATDAALAEARVPAFGPSSTPRSPRALREVMSIPAYLATGALIYEIVAHAFGIAKWALKECDRSVAMECWASGCHSEARFVPVFKRKRIQNLELGRCNHAQSEIPNRPIRKSVSIEAGRSE
jgi:hypothetical protein